MTIHRIKLKDLNQTYLQQLQAQFEDKELEIEIRVPAKHRSDTAVELMDEAKFWDIIYALDWEKSGDDEAVLKPAILQLASFSESDILAY